MRFTPKKLFEFWDKEKSRSADIRVLFAAITIGLLTILVKSSAFIKEMFIAWSFGVEDDLDAFLIALVIPNFIINVVVLSFNSAFIPNYIQVLEQEGRRRANLFLNEVLVWILAFLSFVTFCIIFGANFYIPSLASGFQAQKLQLTFQILYATSPFILLAGLSTIFGAVLTAGQRIVLVSILPVATSIVTILFLAVFRSWGVFSLVSGLICGQIIEVIGLGIALHYQGTFVNLGRFKISPPIRQFASQYIPVVAGSFLMGSTRIVDQSMAAALSAGSVATLSYGNKITLSLLSLLGVAVSTAVIPHFSKIILQENWLIIKNTLTSYVRLIFLVMTPLTVMLLLYSEPIIATIFQRGQFTESDTQVVSQIQALYLLQIPFYLGNIMVVRLINAMKINQVLIYISLFNLFANIALNYLFMNWLGIKGIALSTSCVFFCSFIFLYIFTTAKLKQKILATQVCE